MGQDSHHHKAPPHSDQAEQAVLGAVFKDNGTLDRVRDIIQVQDFYIKRHRVIYSAMLEMANMPSRTAARIVLRTSWSAGDLVNRLVSVLSCASNVSKPAFPRP